MALKRVNHSHPCPICGKTSWCSYNQSIIICARTTDGASRLSANGEGIYEREEKQPDRVSPVGDISLPCSPIDAEATHAIFTTLLALSPLPANSTHITHPTQGLVARGFTDFSTFGYYPGKHSARFRLLKKALQSTPINGSIPGLWYSSRGWEFGWPGDGQDALMIPIRNRDRKIQAIQLRYITDIKENRYRWLSTPSLPQGCGSGTPIHYIYPTSLPSKVLLVEGALKAETLQLYYPQHAMIATAGINYGHAQIINECTKSEFVICFDQDTIDSAAWIEVQFNLLKLLELRFAQRKSLDSTWVTKWNSSHKGIDDAAHENIQIKIIPGQRVLNWLRTIDLHARRQLKRS